MLPSRSKLVSSILAVSADNATLVTVSANSKIVSWLIGAKLPINALNPVLFTSIRSLFWKGPPVMSITSILVAPVATTLALALEVNPETKSPIDGNIPPIVFRLSLVICNICISTFL